MNKNSMELRKTKRDVVAALIFSKDGKILMGTKDPKKGGVYSDCWHLPGGGVEPGETNKQAVIREVKEETGLDISAEQAELADDLGSGTAERTLPDGEQVLVEMRFFAFRVNLQQNAADVVIKLGDDLVHAEWFTKEQLKTVKLTPPSVTLFARLGLSD